LPAKPRLNRQQVLDVARRIANSEGLSALTLNRLARALGVQPPSLYNHVQGLPDLLDTLALRSLQELGDCLAVAAIGKAGNPAVHALADAYRSYMQANPGLYPLTIRPLPSGNSDSSLVQERRLAEARVVKVALAVLASFGLDGEPALHAVRGLRSLAHGFTSLELSGSFGLPLELDQSFHLLVEAYLQGLAVYA
jgi:AcrR family transcriptional regulator